MVSKIDYAVIAAVVAGCACWIEQGHRIVIDAPTLSELAATSSAAACPDNDRVPYSAACLAFQIGDDQTAPGWQVVVAGRKGVPLAYPPKNTELTSAACPDNDNVPYPPECLRYLSGYFWRPE